VDTVIIFENYDVRWRTNEHALLDQLATDGTCSPTQVGVDRVEHFDRFDVYRIERATVLEVAARRLPVAAAIDFFNVGSNRFKLRGWGSPVKPAAGEHAPLGSIAGYGRCANPILSSAKPPPSRCTVVSMPAGLQTLDVVGRARAELMVRIERACDQQLTITFAAPAKVDVTFNDVALLSCGDPQWGTTSVSVRVPQRAVRADYNIISLDDAQSEPRKVRPELRSIVIEPICEPPR